MAHMLKWTTYENNIDTKFLGREYIKMAVGKSDLFFLQKALQLLTRKIFTGIYSILN